MIQLVIMKRYNLFLGIIAVLSAVSLSACDENKGTRTIVYTEQPSYLTIMTQTTTTPADTYSEYMATYSEKETGMENFFAIPHMHGVGADTAMGSFPSGMETAAPITDTAAVLPQTGTLPPPEFFLPVTETASVSASDGSPESTRTSVPENAEASVSESASTTVSTGINGISTITSPLELPAPDTASPHAVKADTAPTMYSTASDTEETDTNTSNGGTDNAHQHTQ